MAMPLKFAPMAEPPPWRDRPEELAAPASVLVMDVGAEHRGDPEPLPPTPGVVEAEHMGDLQAPPAPEEGDGAESSTSLVESLLETAAPRRKKRRQADEQDERGDSTPPYAARTNGDHEAVDDTTLALTLPAAPALDAPDDPAWRAEWPDNEVRIVGRLLPWASDAPALDGVQRTRMELALVEQVGDEFGTMGNLALFVMPSAPGFTPIYNELERARKQHRRRAPIMVEIHGVLRQLPDRDMRYALVRNTVLMGVEEAIEIVKPLRRPISPQSVFAQRRHGTGDGVFPRLTISQRLSRRACRSAPTIPGVSSVVHGTGDGVDPSGGSVSL